MQNHLILTYLTHFDKTHFFYFKVDIIAEKIGFIKMCKIRQN